MIEYKMINVQMKFHVIIHLNVSTMSIWICKTNNVQVRSIKCQQVLKRMINTKVVKTCNKIHMGLFTFKNYTKRRRKSLQDERILGIGSQQFF